jgi:hypothetical protein
MHHSEGFGHTGPRKPSPSDLRYAPKRFVSGLCAQGQATMFVVVIAPPGVMDHGLAGPSDGLNPSGSTPRSSPDRENVQPHTG